MTVLPLQLVLGSTKVWMQGLTTIPPERDAWTSLSSSLATCLWLTLSWHWKGGIMGGVRAHIALEWSHDLCGLIIVIIKFIIHDSRHMHTGKLYFCVWSYIHADFWFLNTQRKWIELNWMEKVCIIHNKKVKKKEMLKMTIASMILSVIMIAIISCDTTKIMHIIISQLLHNNNNFHIQTVHTRSSWTLIIRHQKLLLNNNNNIYNYYTAASAIIQWNSEAQ